jgi:hypothetical protein
MSNALCNSGDVQNQGATLFICKQREWSTYLPSPAVITTDGLRRAIHTNLPVGGDADGW